MRKNSEGRTLVGIMTPSVGEDWKARMSISLIAATSYFLMNQVPGAGVQGYFLKNKRGSILPQLRQQMVKEGLRENPSHILFIDSDQTFPADTINRLLAWDLPVVGCNVATKHPDKPEPTARLKPVGDGKPRLVYTTPTSPKLGEVWRLGCGILMIEAWIFSKLPKPWFYYTWMDDIEDLQGEDWGLCERLEAAGIPIMVDHRLSLEVGHLGGREFTHRDVWEALENEPDTVSANE